MELSVKLSFRQPFQCSGFQAKVATIKAAVVVLFRNATFSREVSIHCKTDELAARSSQLSHLCTSERK